ncbi:protein FAM162B-like [Willisornis vidua]|uniref:Protein FAM162B-like n=1 Tax=Willisornis vidua TaxID=1566151 RepID=A0ABQ9CRI9_9PASS|nr:protein FAM162B-like [Willisornis vidua]
MLGKLLGHSPALWRSVARPVLRPTRAVSNKARDAPGAALQAATAGKEAFRNDRRPTNFDKKVLIWAGRFKKEEDIPKYISSDVLDAARNIVRIKVCYLMIALTVLGCLAMVITGKEPGPEDSVRGRLLSEAGNGAESVLVCCDVQKDQGKCSSHITQVAEGKGKDWEKEETSAVGDQIQII